jgi:PTS system nitrogen regulatory IIA component
MIIPELEAGSKEEAVRKLTDRVFGSLTVSDPLADREEVYRAVMDREELQSTGVGNGLAFPHARIEGWKNFMVCMGVSKKGIDFNSIDGKPVHFVFLMVSSPDEPYIILRAMSSVVRFMSGMEFGRQFLERQMSVEEIVRDFSLLADTMPDRILARDIMRPVSRKVQVNTSMEDVTKEMHLNRVDRLPVVDEKNRFCGEISCLEIFQYSMPEFFNKLETISFVRHIDPFEKYFRIRGNLKVKDVYLKDMTPISENGTLLEIIFEMTVRKRSKLFVVSEKNELTGVIDRFSIIDKILFF